MAKHHSVNRMLGWSAVDQFFRLGFQFLVGVVLARLLTPSDFGVYALLAIFVGLASTLANAGLTDALIQRDVTTHQEESSLFFFTITLAFLIAVTMCISAHWIASFYEKPILVDITYMMAICVLIGSLGSVQVALFSKQLDFKTTAIIGAIAAAISSIVALLAAFSGWGVWSLVAQTFAATVISTLLIWFKHPWRPKFIFDLKLIQPYLKFGGYLLISRLINVVSINLYTIVIGKVYTAQDVGIFNRASNFQNLLVNSMSGIVAKVAFPVFALAASDHQKLERGLNKALLGTVFLSVPISISLVILAKPIVLILFGNQWVDSIPILQILGFEALIWPLHLLNVNLLMSVGRGDLMFRGVLIKFFFTSMMLLLASSYGILVMAIAFVMSSYINLMVNIYFTKKVFDYGFIKQIRAVAPCLLAGVPTIAVMYLTRTVFDSQYLMQLVVCVSVSGLIYLLAGAFLRIYSVQQFRSIIGLKS